MAHAHNVTHQHTDPVCGMKVDPAKAAGTADFAGHSYYFCSLGCRTKFLSDPQKWVSPAPEVAIPGPPPSTAVEYTCPMHPEVVQIGPGSCPICGMALEPRVMTADEPENEELSGMVRRFLDRDGLHDPNRRGGDGGNGVCGDGQAPPDSAPRLD